jgi:exodeoxyribonuclease I
MATAQNQGAPFLHVSGMYPAERGCLALVWPLAPHPSNKNEVIVWDLAVDPTELFTLGVDAVRQRMFTRASDLPPGVERLPIKTIHVNKSPIVIGNLKTLSEPMAARWGIDVAQALRHAERAARDAPALAGLWPEVFGRDDKPGSTDVDEDLYGGFLGNDDRRSLERLRGLAPQVLATKRPAFSDPRLEELLFRFRARNHPETLDAEERSRWDEYCAARLHDGHGGALTLAAFQDRIDALSEAADERGQAILEALVDYAESIAPVR